MNIQKSEKLADDLASSLKNRSFSGSQRNRLSVSCFDVVHEHHRSILLLAAHHLYGSVFTLARPIYEAFVQGMWLRLCATEDQMRKVIDGERSPHLQSLVSAIEKKEKDWGFVLAAIETKHGPVFNSFVHTGMAQIARRNTQNHIESNYDTKEVGYIIGFADALAILAGLQIAIIAGDSALSVELDQKARQYY